MTLNRTNANLSTYFIYHEKDVIYLDVLEARLNLLIDDNLLGNLRFKTLQAFNLRDKTIDSLLQLPSCLICLISPNFIYAIRRDDYLWTELVAAHQNQALLILPILAEDCGNSKHPFLGITVPQTPLVTMRLQIDYTEQLSNLLTYCGQRLAEIITRFSTVEKHWKRAQEIHDVRGYQDFSERFKGCKYEGEAEKRRAELLEEELWESAVAYDDTKHYLHYLKESPLELHRDKAVERIIEIELEFDFIKKDVEENEDLGLLFDYKSRFRKQIDTAWVQERMFIALADTVRLDGDHPWVEAESQLLKIEVYKECSPQEIFTYSLLEDYVKYLNKTLQSVNKKLNDKKASVIFGVVITSFLIIVFSLILKLIGVEIYSVFYALIKKHPLVFLMITFISVLAVRNMIKYLGKEEATSQLIKKTIAKEMIHLKIAFIIKADFGKCLSELHNMEEWGIEVSQKSLWNYAWAEEEEMEFNSHQLRPLRDMRPKNTTT
jgi:hypothetical protein